MLRVNFRNLPTNNTIGSHTHTCIGFFSVGVFNDDSRPLVMEDCFGCCVMEGVFSTNDNPRCRTAGVFNYSKGTVVKTSMTFAGSLWPIRIRWTLLISIFYLFPL